MEDSIFDRLKAGRDESSKVEDAFVDRQQKEHERMVQYFKSIFDRNGSLPVEVPAVVVKGGMPSKYEFLQEQLKPIVDKKDHTVGSLIEAVDKVYKDLASFAIYEKIQINLEEAPPTIFTSSSVLNVRPIINLQHAKRFIARTGTDLGNGEGNGYANFTVKDVFGGAEILSFDATIGTRTRSSYLLNFNSPINNSATWRGEAIGYTTSRNIAYASHDQHLRGLTTKVRSKHQELSFEAVWRTVSANSEYVTQSVRDQAGDTIKGAIVHSWQSDSRDSSSFPTSGLYFKTAQEIAGLLGDVPFIKGSFESQYAASTASKFVTANVGLRGGLLWMAEGRKSHLMDRFYLGGPNDVRGFSLGGIGPRDDGDSLGGDAFLAAGLSVFSKLPKLSPENPLRAQFFVNGGSVLPLIQNAPSETFKQLIYRPSVAMGLGLMYNHPAARFELNFTLPLIAGINENTRKGLQFGVGFSFL